MNGTIAARPIEVVHIPWASQPLAHRMAELGVAALICLSVLAPGLHISSDLPFVRPEQLLLPVIVVMYGWLLLAGYARTIRLSGMFIVALVYCICVLMSSWYGASVLGHSTVARDFYEIPKALLPLAFFVVAYESDLSERSLRLVLKTFSFAILLVCFYAWAQSANLGIASKLNEYYSSGEHVDIILRGIGRVYSTMSNPNVLGQLMTWSIAAFTIAFLLRVGSRAFNALVILSCLATLAMTESRYGLLTAAVGLALILLLPSVSLGRRRVQMVLLALLLPLCVWTFMAVTRTNQHAVARLYSLKQPFRTDSLRDRLDISWPQAMSEFEGSPIFGNGSAKDYFKGTITDSEYLDILKQFGIVGFLAYLGYFLYPLVVSWKGLRAVFRVNPLLEDVLPANVLAVRLSITMIVTALVMNVGESTFLNFLLQGFLWTWMGLGARSARTIAEFSRWYGLRYGHVQEVRVDARRGFLAASGAE